MDQAAYYLHRVISSWVQAAGVLVAAAAFIYSVIRGQLEARLLVYQTSKDAWNKYLSLCADHPELELLPVDPQAFKLPSGKERRLEMLAIAVLLGHIEQHYVLATKTGLFGRVEAKEIRPLLVYLASRRGFEEAFTILAPMYRTDFAKYVKRALAEAKSLPISTDTDGQRP
jgi:hypothetical protein